MKYEVSGTDDEQLIERLTFPRFKAKVTRSEELYILDDIIMIDDCDDVTKTENAIRSAVEFLRKRYRK